MSKTISIETEDGIETHYVSHDGNYATLCGLDGNDHSGSLHKKSGIYQRISSKQSGDVDCGQCLAIVKHVKRLIL